jgi:protein SCO1/2
VKVLFVALVMTTLPVHFTPEARAELTRAELAGVSVSPPAHPAVPLALEFRDVNGKRVTLGQAIDGRPAILLFVDYTCRTICGPALAIASGAIAQTGLDLENRFRLVTIGLDPKDSAEDARAISRQIGDPAVRGITALLLGDADSVRRATEAVGYRYKYDSAADQFAHPAAALVLTPDGRVSRILSSLALNAQDLRLALVEAGAGSIGTFGDRLTLLCYGFDPSHGVYAPAIARMLQILAAFTVISLFGLIAILEKSRGLAKDRG